MTIAVNNCEGGVIPIGRNGRNVKTGDGYLVPHYLWQHKDAKGIKTAATGQFPVRDENGQWVLSGGILVDTANRRLLNGNIPPTAFMSQDSIVSYSNMDIIRAGGAPLFRQTCVGGSSAADLVDPSSNS